mmetsp:Transcript_12078/g.26697  ORF Transcript_12078/g.26697 Transcript_12078/m.26697 type:complete len:280 (-) Transcript_12078:74-913(-)
MGCGASSSKVLPGLGNADLRGLTQDQVAAVYASPQTPRSVKDQIVATRTDVLEETECDFSVVGERLLQEILESEKANYKPCSAIWTHPTSGGQLFIANQASATSKDVLQEHKVGFIVNCLDYLGTPAPFHDDPDVRYLYYPVAYWREAASDRSPKSVARVLAPLLGSVRDNLEKGGSVMIHCLAGCHRAGTAGVAGLMELCNLDFKSALCAAKVARPSVDPMAHLQALLRKFELAKRHGVVEKAVEQARQQGFQEASNAVFNIKPPKQGPSSESNALET